MVIDLTVADAHHSELNTGYWMFHQIIDPMVTFLDRSKIYIVAVLATSTILKVNRSSVELVNGYSHDCLPSCVHSSYHT